MNYNKPKYNFILSNKFSFRLKRHISFWFAIILFYTSQNCFEHYRFEAGFFDNVLSSLAYIPFKIFLSDIIFCYSVIYFLIPKLFLKKRYFLFCLSLLATSVIVLLISDYYKYRHFQVPSNALFRFIWGSIIEFIFQGPVAISGIFIAIRVLKAFYLKEEEKQTLIAENANAELQLLKAQVHPHFLFNTLNNIYSFTLTKDPRAVALLDKLAGMLEYMQMEGEHSLVFFEKEIKLVENYLGLERVRYGSRLMMEITINGDYEDKLIAPLLMIPFVENCFKHGVSIMRGKQWIQLNIRVEGDELYFTLSNSKPSQDHGVTHKKGIGLNNVRKRLELLYTGKYSLAIESTDNSYTVCLQLSLQPASMGANAANPILKLQTA
jgi:sensor histidine kinase YesM